MSWCMEDLLVCATDAAVLRSDDMVAWRIYCRDTLQIDGCEIRHDFIDKWHELIKRRMRLLVIAMNIRCTVIVAANCHNLIHPPKMT